MNKFIPVLLKVWQGNINLQPFLIIIRQQHIHETAYFSKSKNVSTEGEKQAPHEMKNLNLAVRRTI